MKTKTRTRKRSAGTTTVAREPAEHSLELFSEEELEEILFEEASKSPPGPFNFATVAGLGLLTLSAMYVWQLIGLAPWSLGWLFQLLPWLAVVLVFLVGLSPARSRKRRRARQRRKRRRALARQTKRRSKEHSHERVHKRRVASAAERPEKATAVAKEEKKGFRSMRNRRLYRSRDKQICGVAGGLANYFAVDPTLIRILFIVSILFSSGLTIAAYFAVAIVMKYPPPGDDPPVSVDTGGTT